MSDIIDINVAQTVEEVTINVVDNVIQVNINQVNGGGSQDLNETLVNGNATDGEDILLSDGDSILLDNGSKLKKGTTNAGNGGNNGIALKCSLDYEFKWEAGRMYIMQQDGVGIRETRYNFNVAPTVNDDDTKGYAVDSRWILDNGDLYICTDATEGAAVWELQSTISTLQEVLDNNHDLVDGNFFAGTDAGEDNTGISVIAIGEVAGSGNSGNNGVFLGNISGIINTGNSVNALGSSAGLNNTFNYVNLFGESANADEDGQTVLSKDGAIMARISTIDLTDTRKYNLPDADGTIALTSDIPTNTSDLVNDGENGTSPYVTADQLPSNLNLFATNVSSDIATYFKLVTSIDDPDYNDTPVNIPTGTITTTGQFIAALATTANVLVGNPGIINLLTIGNVRRTSGSGTAEFYYEVYHRDSGGTETLISTSSKTPPINTNVYTEFLAASLLNNGTFLTTDRIVVKYYADRVGSGSNPNYDFQFGGTSPVRTNFPVPASNIPLDAIPTDGSTNGVQSNGVFDALATKVNKSRFIYQPKVSVTGVTGETNLCSFKINGGAYENTDAFKLDFTCIKSVTASTSTWKVYIGLTSGARTNQIMQTAVGTTGRSSDNTRRYNIDATSLDCSVLFTTNANSGLGSQTNVNTPISVNMANDLWITITANPTVISESHGVLMASITPLK